MTETEFLVERNALTEKIKEINKEIDTLRQKYIDDYPFKIGDKVEYKGKEYFIFKFQTYLRDTPVPCLSKPKKDGTMSMASAGIWASIKPEDLKLIERNG